MKQNSKLSLAIISLCGILLLLTYKKKYLSTPNYFINLTTVEEEEFPIAYSIVVYRDPDQIFRLFRAIYRPSNYYCFHVDTKSPNSVEEVVNKFWMMHDNVILPNKAISVVHAQFSVLEAEIECMKALLSIDKQLQKTDKVNKDINWKYLISLTGQEWPLKTNLEIVRILKALNGSNSIEKLPFPTDRLSRKTIPHNIKLWKGSLRIIVKREFAEFALTNPRALALLKYLRNAGIVPDETFYSTLNNDHSFRAPGGYSGNLIRHPTKLPFISRHVIWKDEGQCYGVLLRDVCIFGVNDIPAMIDVKNPHLFANKFVKGINDDVLDYMEIWYYERMKLVYSDISKNPLINLNFYKNLTITKDHF